MVFTAVLSFTMYLCFNLSCISKCIKLAMACIFLGKSKAWYFPCSNEQTELFQKIECPKHRLHRAMMTDHTLFLRVSELWRIFSLGDKWGGGGTNLLSSNHISWYEDSWRGPTIWTDTVSCHCFVILRGKYLAKAVSFILLSLFGRKIKQMPSLVNSLDRFRTYICIY